MRVRALVEVTVVFGLSLLLVTAVGLSPIGEWGRRVYGRPFIEYAVMIALPLALLIVSRRELRSYGLSLRDPWYHLDVAATAFVPVAIASVPLGFVDHRAWSGSLVLALVQIALLLVLGRLLEHKPTRSEGGLMCGAALAAVGIGFAQSGAVTNAVSAVVFYLCFLAPGEELLFRGYIQSRLNVAFGRRFRFYGVNWGWGVVIASALFGMMHVLNLASLVTGSWEPAWWWGVWTWSAGLVLGFVREKTGSILAPIILHGLPQAIAYAMMGR